MKNLWVVIFWAGCGFSGAPAGAGATQGGVQDMGYARELIADGKIPPASAFVVEGMFSEHDLGLNGPPCERELCLMGAYGIDKDREGVSSAWLQVGMSSSLTPDAYQRPSTSFIMTVDTSGSMGFGGHEETPGEIARGLLEKLGERIRPDDRIAVVTYGSRVQTDLSLRGGDEVASYQRVVNELRTSGVTNMEAGLNRAYELAEEALDGETEEVRVMLFTDVRPNTGASTATEFDGIVQEGGQLGVGLTVFAIGDAMGQDVLRAIADVRGGNGFSLFSHEDVDELLADDWPFLAAPLAYDLTVGLSSAELAVKKGYGFPSDSELELHAASVFLSRRRGALLAQLVPDPQLELVGAFQIEGNIQYTKNDGVQVSEGFLMNYDGSQADGYFEQNAVNRTVELALLVEAMEEAARIYSENPDQAVGVMSDALERYNSNEHLLANEEMIREQELARALLALLESGASQVPEYSRY